MKKWIIYTFWGILLFGTMSCAQQNSEKNVIEQVKKLTDELIAKGEFSGAILLAKNDKVLYNAAGGEANKSFHVPNKIDTKFNLGSMNKMFTSVAIMKLIEEGRLSLNDKISRYIDNSWLPEEMTSKITIENLLTHSSGLGSYFNEMYFKSSRELFRKIDDYKPLIKGERLQFEPGSRFSYSNTGMFLLGAVLEKITGQDYFSYIRKTIYEPAGMINSDSYEMDEPVENLAIGYSRDNSSSTGWRNNLYKHTIKGGPAGGGFSTVIDLHKFALALLSGKYITKTNLEKMWKGYLSANYGYGFQVRQTSDGKVVGHTGGFPGINSVLEIHLDSGYIVAAMSNYDRGAVELARKITEIIADQGTKVSK